jgi:hypothetical protein
MLRVRDCFGRNAFGVATPNRFCSLRCADSADSGLSARSAYRVGFAHLSRSRSPFPFSCLPFLHASRPACLCLNPNVISFYSEAEENFMSVRIFAALGLLALPAVAFAQDKPADTPPNQTAPKPPTIAVPT